MSESTVTPVDQLSFEAAVAELEKIVSQLESGQGDLENSIEAYERGVVLKKHCEAKLKEAEAKIEKITIDENGTAKTEKFEIAGS
jgi:exodeoxyribonuclease VII small subunit